MDILNEIKWRPTIGDPTFMGWFTVAAYFVAAFMAGRVWRITTGRIWLFTCLAMAGFGINKQLDLQSLFTDLGRVAAYRNGWYEERRLVQKWFVFTTIGLSVSLTAWSLWRFRNFWSRHTILLAGFQFLATFIVVRAISFHHVDQFLNSRLLGAKMNWLLELGGIALIALAAVREIRAKKDSSP
jgi:hypothetical protein